MKACSTIFFEKCMAERVHTYKPRVHPIYIHNINTFKRLFKYETQIWKSLMGLQDRAFKNCKKWIPAYKENWRWGSNLDKCLFSYQKQSNKDWNTLICLQKDSPSIKYHLISFFFIKPFNFGNVYIISRGLDGGIDTSKIVLMII